MQLMRLFPFFLPQKRKFYYFSALYPLTVNFVIDLNKIDFDQQELRTLPLGGAKWDKETVLVGVRCGSLCSLPCPLAWKPSRRCR